MTNDYPEELIRGISSDNEQFITPEGYPTHAAFQFDAYDNELRNGDGFCELSINWLDDDGAIETLLNQINPKKQAPQFQGGYCRINRRNIHILSPYIQNGHLSYERKPVEADEENGFQENKYHGNILLKNNVSKAIRTNIQSALAAFAGIVIKREP